MAEEPQKTPETPGRAMFLIDWRFISQLVELPEGVEISGVYDDPQHGGVAVHLRGDALPPVAANQYPPTLWPRFEFFRIGDIYVATRVTFDLPPDTNNEQERGERQR